MVLILDPASQWNSLTGRNDAKPSSTMATVCTNLQRLPVGALEDSRVANVTINYHVTGIFVIALKLTFISSGGLYL